MFSSKNRSARTGSFLILGTQRSGSQALRGAIDQHPDVVSGDEWTLRVPPLRKIRALDRALSGDFADLISHWPDHQMRMTSTFNSSTRWLGFKILFRASPKYVIHPRLSPAITFDRLEAHIRWVRRHPEIRIIHIVRENATEWLKSRYLAAKTRNYASKPYPSGVQVDIPVKSACKAVLAKNWIDKRLASLAKTNPYHRVTYEDFLICNMRELEHCLMFLGVNLTRLPEEIHFFVRQSLGPASDYIQNYEELESGLKKAGLA